MKNGVRAGETATPISKTQEKREEVCRRNHRIAELDNKLNHPTYWIGSAGYPEREAVADVNELLKLEVMMLQEESNGQISHQEALKKATERHPIVTDVRRKLEPRRDMER